MIEQQLHHQRAGNLIRKIGDQPKGTTLQRIDNLRRQHPRPTEAITANELHAVTKPRLDQVGELLIEFARDHISAAIEQRLGQCSRTWADFKHQITLTHIGIINKLAQQILIV